MHKEGKIKYLFQVINHISHCFCLGEKTSISSPLTSPLYLLVPGEDVEARLYLLSRHSPLPDAEVGSDKGIGPKPAKKNTRTVKPVGCGP